MKLSVFLAFAILLLTPPVSPAAPPSVVKLERHGEGWRLSRNGQPFFIKGAVGWSHLDQLVAAGGNAVRLGANEKSLDQAQRLGLGALVGLPLGKITEQRERIRQPVLKLKDHPAVLMWAIGNLPAVYHTGASGMSLRAPATLRVTPSTPPASPR